jgi:hypothetical protein
MSYKSYMGYLNYMSCVAPIAHQVSRFTFPATRTTQHASLFTPPTSVTKPTSTTAYENNESR